MRTLLVSLASYKAPYLAPKTPASLPLLYLKLMAQQRGFDRVDLKEFLLENSDETILKKLTGQKYEVISFACYVWNIKRVLKLAKLLKEQNPAANIVLGGPEAGPIAEEILRNNPQIDYIIRNEGEIAFPNLLEALEKGSPLSAVKGLTFRAAGGNIVKNADQPFVDDLSQIPSVYLDSGLDFSESQYLNLETSRGCPRRCRYCQWSANAKIRYFPLERVLKELKFINRLPKLFCLYIVDSCIYYDKVRALKIFEALANFPKQCNIYFELDVNLMDEQIVESMSQIPSATFSFGLQTISPKVAKTINRKTDLDKFKRNLALLKKKNPRAKISLDLIYGLPGDDLASYKATLDFAMSLAPHNFFLYPFILLVGSEFYRRREEFGLKFDPAPPRWVYSSDSFPQEDREQARRLSYYIQFFYSQPMVRTAMDLLWLGANKYKPTGHVELYEKLIEYVEERLDLKGAWDEVGAGGYERFDLVFAGDPKKREAFFRFFGEFMKQSPRLIA